jgi:superfamily II DNA/RNA helicase
LDSGDSFFAREAEISYETSVFGRKYVGLMPSGKTKAMMEIRAMAALLQRIHMMKLPDEVKDKLWTLTAYFNSLKDLGKASTLVEDDVKDFIKRTGYRLFTPSRLIISADELTSRVTTTELNETLDKLEKLEYSRANMDNKRYASNVLLATNMISVGIDVARLNVMLLIGQPKLTSEYIQASSRVGRSFPGVAFVQYDATKSRDRSHYERFRSYHESFYRFVEPTGATPFSKPARERALHAVVTSIIRQRTGLSEDKDAIYFDKDFFADAAREAEQFILDRIKQINIRAKSGLDDDIADVETEIREFIDEWHKNAKIADEAKASYYFGRRFMVAPLSAGLGRLLRQYNSSGKDNSIETLTSMRNVDTQVLGEIVIWEGN